MIAGRFAWATWALVAATLIVLPLALHDYGLYLATEILIWATLAVSLDLMLGYTGLPSFGHAVFFGVPAYAFAIVLVRYDSIAIALVAGYIAVFAIAALVGYFATRTGGSGYIIVTLLASFVLYTFVMTATKLTGGEDGLLIPRSRSFAVLSPVETYCLIAVIVSAMFVGARLLVRSNFGLVLLAIKSNEGRVHPMGYNVDAVKLTVTLISAAMAGTTGMLYALLTRTLSAELVGPALSTEVVIWVLLGGVQTLIGSVIGAAVFVALKQLLSATTWYPLILGFLFIAVVCWAPRGLASLLSLPVSWLSSIKRDKKS
jgi:branched-chain amino acid transport system permease protein